MKEIKFRVWNEVGKRMTDCGLAIKGNEVVHQIGFKVTQFIGRKDKNGKEIYEGDIVKDEDIIDVVEFIDGCFVAVDPEGIDEGNIIIDSWEENNFEVIGNIYENPKLLVVKK